MNRVSGETRLPASIKDLGFAARECAYIFTVLLQVENKM